MLNIVGLNGDNANTLSNLLDSKKMIPRINRITAKYIAPATVVISDGCYYDGSSYRDAEGLETTSDVFTFTTQSEPQENNPPTADANGPYSGNVNDSMTFDGSGSYDDGSITKYTWDFGDGTEGYGSSPTHIYNTANTYTVALTVKDDDGLTDTGTTTVAITEQQNGAQYHPNAKINGPYSGYVCALHGHQPGGESPLPSISYSEGQSKRLKRSGIQIMVFGWQVHNCEVVDEGSCRQNHRPES